MLALVKGRRDWPAVLSLGFNIDRHGNRRKPVWVNIVTLGILLPGFAMWGLYRVFTTPTSIGLWALAAAMYLFTMFGVTLGNHRYWTHRGLRPDSRCRWCWPWRAACRWKATSSNG
jgi:fatty-acid desaturase